MFKSLNIGGELVNLSKPKVMGIVNVTPDSFYKDSRAIGENELKTRFKQIISEGGDWFDIGAASSRPGAGLSNVDQEIERLKPALSIARELFPKIPISVDTYWTEVARWAYENFNVEIINDISAGNIDNEMPDFIACENLCYIAMHMKGTPEKMQNLPEYDNVVRDLILFFSKKAEQFRLLGINNLVFDPGFGFGKTLDHNYAILKHLDEFAVLGLPVLVGVSRKSMIYSLLGVSPEDSLNGSTAIHAIALKKGANILRVHDVKEAVETIRIVDKMKKSL